MNTTVPLCVASVGQTFGVVFKYLSSSLSEEAVLIQPILNISQPSDSVPQVVAQRGQTPAVPRVQQMQIPVQIVIISERTESRIVNYYLASVFSFFLECCDPTSTSSSR